MTTAARLAKLEGALSPKGATLSWLAEAHQFPTLMTYVAWLREQPLEAAPFYRVPDQAERAVRAALRSEPRSVIEAAVHQAVRDAVFLVELVVVLNVEAEEMVQAAVRQVAALTWEGRAFAAENATTRTVRRTRRRPDAREARWQAGADRLASEITAADVARGLVEARHLDDRRVLFPGTALAWLTLREGLAAVRTAGVGPERSGRPGEAPRRAAGGLTLDDDRTALVRAHAMALVELAQARALDLLGR